MALKGRISDPPKYSEGSYSFLVLPWIPAGGNYPAILVDLSGEQRARRALSARSSWSDPNHPPVEIADVTWGWTESVENGRVAHVGSFEVRVALARFSTGRKPNGSSRGCELFPSSSSPCRSHSSCADGPRSPTPTSLANVEIVASDDRFELRSHASRKSCVHEAGGKQPSPPPGRSLPRCWRGIERVLDRRRPSHRRQLTPSS